MTGSADGMARIDFDLPVAATTTDPDHPPRLRIAFFVNEFPALSETFVLTQIVGLIRQGHQVTIFANRPRDDPSCHDDVAHYNLRAATRYLTMPAGRIARVAKALPLLVQNFHRRPRTTLRALNVFRYGRHAASLRLFYWTLCFGDEHTFDILHCHFGTVAALAATLAEIGAVRGRLIAVFHGADMSAGMIDLGRQYRHLFARGDMFMPVSYLWRQRLLQAGCDARRIVVHPMGVDLQRLNHRARAFRPDRPLHVLSVGRLVEKKGIAYGLRAIAGLHAASVPVQYTIIGDGPLRRRLEQLAAELGIAGIVRFLGWRTQDAVLAAMEAHDVLLAPSTTSSDGDQEGIPVTLMEAMACGLPVVSTYHSGIPELVEHGESGLLAPERDAASLTAALLRLARDPATFSRVSRGGREKISREHDARNLNRSLVGHYRRLLAGNTESAS